MKRLIFTGTAPGQAECVRIGGREFRRGETYQLTDKVAADLLRRGGFEPVPTDDEPVEHDEED